MEISTADHQHSLIEELIMAPMIETHFSNEFQLPENWSFSTTTTPFDHQIFPEFHHLPPTSTYPSLLDYNINHPCSFGEFRPFLLDASTLPVFGSFNEKDDHLPLPILPVHHEENVGNSTSDHQVDFHVDHVNGFEDVMSNYKFEIMGTNNINISNTDITNNNNNVDLYGDQKNKTKRTTNGQPSKNLLAERRRRKRLNDRLSMLRSIVPKISKMDRTSILGDTIDYMRELLDKIHKLREEGMDENVSLIGNYLKELKPNEMLVRNPSKFDIERREQDTRVDVCCTAKPGLLLSTLSTMDVLGLDIHQCVISCFNDFSLQASCYEVAEHRSIVSCEDVKQALFRNAGYGGRCL